MIPFFSFNKYIFFSFLAVGFCPKNNGFAPVWGLQPTPALSPLARTPMLTSDNISKHYIVGRHCWKWKYSLSLARRSMTTTVSVIHLGYSISLKHHCSNNRRVDRTYILAVMTKTDGQKLTHRQRYWCWTWTIKRLSGVGRQIWCSVMPKIH